MSTPNSINVSIAPIEAQLQRTTEDFATHVEFEGGDPDVVASGQAIVEHTKQRLVALRQEVEAIALDPDTSDAKKTKLAGEAVSQADTDLQSVRKDAQVKQAAHDEVKRQLTAIPKPQTNETTDYLIGAEIRQRMSRMPQAERMKVFAEAVTRKNVAVQRAIANDPLNEELIPREYVERVIQEHAQQTEGKAWTRLKSLQLVSDRLRMIAVALDLSLKGYGQIPSFQTPAIGKADLKMQDTQAAPQKLKAADRLPTNTPAFV
jgi:hypothetical protein